MRIASRVFDLIGPAGISPRRVCFEVHRPAAGTRFGWYTRVRLLDSGQDEPLHARDWFGADALHSLTQGIAYASTLLGSWQTGRLAADGLRLTWGGSDHLDLPFQPAWDPPFRSVRMPLQRMTRAQRRPLTKDLDQRQRRRMERVSARERVTRLAWRDLEVRGIDGRIQRRAAIDFDAPHQADNGSWMGSARFLDGALPGPVTRCSAAGADSLAALIATVFAAASTARELQREYGEQDLRLTDSGQDELDIVGVLGIPGSDIAQGD